MAGTHDVDDIIGDGPSSGVPICVAMDARRHALHAEYGAPLFLLQPRSGGYSRDAF